MRRINEAGKWQQFTQFNILKGSISNKLGYASEIKILLYYQKA